MNFKMPAKIIKRGGTKVQFDPSRIHRSVYQASYAVLKDKKNAEIVAEKLTPICVEKIGKELENEVPDIETIQNIVENSLMHEGYSHIARAYILHRKAHEAVRFAKSALKVKDDLKLPVNTLEVLKKRYLLKDNQQNIIETPSELFRRVAAHVAKAEDDFKSDNSRTEIEEDFYQMMRNREFMPNSPTLMNAGTSFGQLSACFVLPVEDSMEGIFTSLKNMAKIHQTGGGTGFSFSKLRPKGALVSSTKGQASGPISFMSIYDKATGVIVQGGRRRGANMGILRCDHPDIIDFIETKNQKGSFENFNLSVAATDEFMQAVKTGDTFQLKDPHSKKPIKKENARDIFDLIVSSAWRTGDPGLIFIDEINRNNPTPSLGRIESTNPCGELPLLPYESCNLGSINLAKMVKDGKCNWEKLKEKVHAGIRFLDNVVEVNKYPLKKIREMTLGNRKIGLGVMGFAEMLILLEIKYNSPQAVNFAKELMKFIHTESVKASMSLAQERGVFPNFEKSVYFSENKQIRNATVNTIAPTGTISIIAGCSSGIEPLFAISFVRNVLSGSKLFEVNPFFKKEAEEKGLYKKDILSRIANSGSLQNIDEISEEMKERYITAFDVSAKYHLLIQGAFQQFADNAVSKTINLPKDSSIEDVRNIYLEAHKLKCKGITVYRYGSKSEQVLSFGQKQEGSADYGDEILSADSEYSGGCAVGTCCF